MSATIIMSSFGEYHRVSRPDGASKSPNYAARRLGAVLVVCATLFSSVVLGQAMLSSLSAQPAAAAGINAADLAAVGATTADGSGVTAQLTHVARSGDSLWSIADLHRGSVERGVYLDALLDLNGSGRIVVGQAVILPN